MTHCLERPEGSQSTHKVEVVPVVLEPIPGADRVALARVHGYTCVTEKTQWAGRPLAAYVPPDSLVDVTRPEFSFLMKDAKYGDDKMLARIKAKRIRGVLSFGLLVPAPDGAAEGEDVAAALGVRHYDPPVRGAGGQNRGGLFSGGEVAKAPDVYCVKYDVDAGRRYALRAFEPGEPVVVTEKIHGANARYVFHDGRMNCGSRTEWKKEYPNHDHVTVEALVGTGKVTPERAEEIVSKLRNEPKRRNMWWQALDATPALRAFCEANPGVVVYGEVYGAVQDLNYGCAKGEVRFAAFDLMKDGRWLNANEARTLGAKLPWVPAITLFGIFDDGIRTNGMPFDFDRICELAEGKSLVFGANNVREGVVVSPLVERWDAACGRVKLKWVGCSYLSRNDQAEALMEEEIYVDAAGSL
jgi:RNA ligase (TIGR02306 family)